MQLIGKIVGDKAGDSPNCRSARIVEADHAADLQHAVEIYEIDQRRVEVVAAINVRKLDFLRRVLNKVHWESDFGRHLKKYMILLEAKLLHKSRTRLPCPIPKIRVYRNELAVPGRKCGEKKACRRTPAESGLDD